MNNKDVFIMMIEGMIDKDKEKLEKSLSNDAVLYHMSGKAETKEEYINDILNGTLNYYDYELLSFENNRAIIKLLAKVYGGMKMWWTLKMNIVFDDLNKIKECKVGLENEL